MNSVQSLQVIFKISITAMSRTTNYPYKQSNVMIGKETSSLSLNRDTMTDKI